MIITASLVSIQVLLSFTATASPAGIIACCFIVNSDLCFLTTVMRCGHTYTRVPGLLTLEVSLKSGCLETICAHQHTSCQRPVCSDIRARNKAYTDVILPLLASW